MPVIPALERLRQEDLKFEASLGYTVKCLKKRKKKKPHYTHKDIHLLIV
jgi:hypothetical protein